MDSGYLTTVVITVFSFVHGFYILEKNDDSLLFGLPKIHIDYSIQKNKNFALWKRRSLNSWYYSN